MKNKRLIKRWKNLAIQFKSSKETKPMTDMFLICWGNHDIDFNGKKETVVVFDEGSNPGTAPSFYCQSDKDNNCWVFAWNGKTFIKSNIGKFVKNETV